MKRLLSDYRSRAFSAFRHRCQKKFAGCWSSCWAPPSPYRTLTSSPATIALRLLRLISDSVPPKSPCFRDRKSTRLNSSHANISYAVFCLKKKKKLCIQHEHASLLVLSL